MRYPHTASLLVNVGSSAQFAIGFAPDIARRSQAQLKVAVISNQYEDSIVQLVSEKPGLGLVHDQKVQILKKTKSLDFFLLTKIPLLNSYCSILCTVVTMNLFYTEEIKFPTFEFQNFLSGWRGL